MTPSELKSLLEPFGIRPLKARGQHFLLDDGVVERMVHTAGIRKGDPVLEIGPGPGILTEALLGAGADVVAVELDSKLHALLEKRFSDRACTILRGDILSFAAEDLVTEFADPARAFDDGYRIVANLPYAITSKIIEKILVDIPTPKSATIMIQKEVAERITAQPGAMSSIAVFVQTLADVTITDRVPRGAFYPPPKVDSAVIHMIGKEQTDTEAFGGATREAFFAAVRQGFSSPRKKLANTLQGMYRSRDDMEKAFNRAELSISVRPAEVSVGQWKILVSGMESRVGK